MRRIVICTVFSMVLVATGAAGASFELTSINFPEQTSVGVPFTGQPGAPDAKVDAKVTYRDGQSTIELQYQSMKPAILYGGDVSCYVIWAVTRDGRAENLGEVLAAQPKGQLGFSTGKKSFALIISAEPFYLVNKPSELVVFVSDPPKQKKIASTPFTLKELAPAPATAMDSITDIAWESKEPLGLLQARKAYELATRNEASTYARSIYKEAGESLDEANDLAKKKPKSKQMQDAARQAVELSNEAINISQQRLARMELNALIDARRAEMERLEVQKVEAEAAIAELLREQKSLESAVVGMNREKKAAQAQAADLGAMLGMALSKVAEARNTAQGYVIDLPDILFGVNQTSLKPAAEKPLAKLAGILLIMQGLDVAIEGHTDSSGSIENNVQLSKLRAESVRDFLATEGVSIDRLRAVGVGPEAPIADNETAEGRSKNRRVQLTIAARSPMVDR